MSGNDKAFGVKDLNPNKSGLIPGKTGDGNNADPLTTAKHSRQEVDELIALGKEARGENLGNLPEHKGETKQFFKYDCPPPIPYTPPVVNDDLQRLLQTEYINGRLTDVEKQLDDLEDRLVKAFKHAGFEF